MKTKFAKAKSEYSQALHNFINLTLTHKERYKNYRRMTEIEKYLKEEGDEICIIISTINTTPKGITAPPMEE